MGATVVHASFQVSKLMVFFCCMRGRQGIGRSSFTSALGLTRPGTHALAVRGREADLGSSGVLVLLLTAAAEDGRLGESRAILLEDRGGV